MPSVSSLCTLWPEAGLNWNSPSGVSGTVVRRVAFSPFDLKHRNRDYQDNLIRPGNSGFLQWCCWNSIRMYPSENTEERRWVVSTFSPLADDCLRLLEQFFSDAGQSYLEIGGGPADLFTGL